MCASKFIRAFVLSCSVLLLVTASAALFNRGKNDQLELRPGNSRAQGKWELDLDAYRSRRHGIQIEIREGGSTYSFYLPTDRAPIIPKTRDGAQIQFSISSDPGELRFTGEVNRGIASGLYNFEPNKSFVAEASKLLKRDLSNDDLLELTWSDVTLAYIKEVESAGVAINYEDILSLRRHGLKADAIKEFVTAGVEKAKDIINLHNHGVTPEYARKARELGHGKSIDELTRLRNHGVSTDYLQAWNDSGTSPTSEEIIKLRNHGVQAEYAAAWKKAGFDFSHEELIRAKNHGVPSDFPAALAEIGKKPKIEEVIRLRQYGVTAEYYREMKSASPKLTTEEITRFRQHGVQSDYVKTLVKNGANFTAEQIVSLRNHGVPADYVAAINVEGRTPLDAQAIIELRNRGVSAETARKLRQ
jgi:hypothetical protein